VERAAASWWRGRRRGGEGSGLEAWRFQRDRGRQSGESGGVVGESGGIVVESGGVVVEGAASWWRERRCGGEGSTWEGFQFQRERERERICDL
jgi:hypothetical protein